MAFYKMRSTINRTIILLRNQEENMGKEGYVSRETTEKTAQGSFSMDIEKTKKRKVRKQKEN